MKTKSKVFKGICFAGMLFIALSTVSCSKPTCDLMNGQPPIGHQLSVVKNHLVAEHVYDIILPDKHPVYASMAGAGDSEDGEGFLIRIFGGILLFFGATGVLWWNESRYLRRKHTLEEVDKVCVIMENPNTRDPQLEGKLVCATAIASTEEILSDTDFGIKINAISLSREVKYFQWVEEKEKEDRRTTYKYKKKWVDKPIDSESFHDPDYHSNFVIVEIENMIQYARKVSFGAYFLNDELKEFMVPEPLNLKLDNKILEKWNNIVAKSLGMSTQDAPNETTDTFTDSLLDTGNEAQSQEENLTISGNEVPTPQKKYDYVHTEKNMLYFGQKPRKPSIGDVRIYFNKVLEGTVTVVSQVAGNTFVPYESRVEQDYQTLVMGESNDDLIIENETKENKEAHWVIRLWASLATGVGLFMSFNILFQILIYLFDFIPLIAKYLISLVDLTGMIFFIACLLVGIAWSAINIFLAWIINLVIVNIDDWMG
ncbi:MAG: TMEM43 family protein [Prevotella sp.]|nr:TMEM43 family protein [Prevotella sp.]